jgi:hypothetical protein
MSHRFLALLPLPLLLFAAACSERADAIGGARVDASTGQVNTGPTTPEAGPIVTPGPGVDDDGGTVDGQVADANVNEASTDAGTPATPCPACVTTLGTGLGEIIGMDGKYLYAFNFPSNSQTVGFVKVPLAGGTTITLTSFPNTYQPEVAVIDDTNVYWTSTGYCPANDAGTWSCDTGVFSAPLAGGPMLKLAHATMPTYGIALNGGDLYWTDFTGALTHMQLDGGSPENLASGIFTSTNDFVFSLLANPSGVYWTPREPGCDGGSCYALRFEPKGGGATTTVQSNVGYLLSLNGDDVHTFSPEDGGSSFSVSRVPLDGGSPSLLNTESCSPNRVPGHIAGLVDDGTNLYWFDVAAGTLFRAPLGGGPVTTLATNQSPGQLFVDATSVYWVGETTGSLMRYSPK